ncbi:homeobox domain-containing protein [Vairimorpha apis BRL 01]|uniref:Homeobox domain-containing protein n=1 Tax=Vairimorpha apis BRL 01 TaxID=1037528 RepID=T0L3E1_9MICR|nr:homeobox domain-containing protein [Vairimorpha apis BRL 01]
MTNHLTKKELEYQATLGLVRLKRTYTNYFDIMHKGRKTLFQSMVLAEVFKLTGYPSTQTKMDISLLIDLSFSTIQIWFQNERRSRHNENEYFEINVLTLFNIVNDVKQKISTN